MALSRTLPASRLVAPSPSQLPGIDVDAIGDVKKAQR